MTGTDVSYRGLYIKDRIVSIKALGFGDSPDNCSSVLVKKTTILSEQIWYVGVRQFFTERRHGAW